MPLKRCQKNNKKGWKWGDSGTCYVNGNDSQNRYLAAKQGRAIETSKKK